MHKIKHWSKNLYWNSLKRQFMDKAAGTEYPSIGNIPLLIVVGDRIAQLVLNTDQTGGVYYIGKDKKPIAHIKRAN